MKAGMKVSREGTGVWQETGHETLLNHTAKHLVANSGLEFTYRKRQGHALEV